MFAKSCSNVVYIVHASVHVYALCVHVAAYNVAQENIATRKLGTLLLLS